MNLLGCCWPTATSKAPAIALTTRFDAAHYALILSVAAADPAKTRTHSGLISAFGKHLVKTGRIPADLGRTLNQVERMRLLADYTGEDIEPERALWVVEQAAVFLCAIKGAFVLE